ncbi:MAG: chromosome segregation protein SMC [Proteobacteria bacterium]|nr:chromosome segregation protein SMC [Pseudomonadota bacterium]
MRLSTIKLAGFKSFVDPTVLHFPTNLTGIVGPNGCGKSNIIDAIRWVMGESAASRLRGEALTDVIFSGSSGRKPVGQATVELVFDNSDGAIGGEYAGYNEISVKRVVGRDSQSDYFLNGVRCRRRDITDLFLGTGLGARSYSIIEQGIISDIVESHPEQLRVHLEEAAGISRYKERRKETESRIKATRENLDRVRDVREEVEKQLDHLNRQARAAERWKKLKEEHTRREAELRALSYRVIAQELAQHREALHEAETDIEKQLAGQRHVEAAIETGRVRHQEHVDALNAVQAEVYQVGAELARIEQQITHHRELGERLRQAREQAEQARNEVDEHLANDRAQHANLRDALAEGEPESQRLGEAEARTGDELRAAEAAYAAWQERWDAHGGDTASTSREAEIERTNIEHLDRQGVELSRRRETLQNERAGYDLDTLHRVAETLQADHASQRERVEALTGQMDARKADAERLLGEERQAQAWLAEARAQEQSLRGRLASLEALQHAALGQDRDHAREWLQQFGLAGASRLGSQLQVEPGWERAVETVLAGLLEGVLVDDPLGLAVDMAAIEGADLGLVASRAGSTDNAAGTLAAQARGPAAAIALLAHVRTADDVAQARAMAATLTAPQSVVTREGMWLGPGFARVRRAEGGQVGMLARARELQSIGVEVAQVTARLEELARRAEEVRAQRMEAEQARDDLQRELYGTHRRLSELAGELQGKRGRIDSAQARLQALDEELAEIAGRANENAERVRDARARMEAAVSRMSEHERARVELEGDRRRLLEQREAVRADAQEAADAAHRHALALESRRASLASLEQSLSRLQAQRVQLDARLAELDQQIGAGGDPVAALENERQTCLDQRLQVDRRLVDARRSVEEADAEWRRLEQQRHAAEESLVAQREALAQRRLAEQALAMRAEQLAEAIHAAGLQVEPLLAELAEDTQPQEWQQRLEDLAAKIARLEPVNLAAIAEHAESAQRKEYLDAQLADLTSALETLDGAIKKIDKETRQRFKDTFDRVNAGFQSLFPQLFGGGHAHLELTGEDLLDTGVAIMARPPGKRVSHISLLSGGEKAMTAVALVFSIFNLNPAPFCLLDEVDAPLDEGNVGRFGQLVRDMAEKVQFVIVTHNKATMESTNQLCGVTMREPGVSRLVQVDLEEAAKLAGAA